MGKKTLLFIVPYDLADPWGFAGEVLLERRRQGYNVGESSFEYLLRPHQVRNRWEDLVPIPDVDLTYVAAVIEPDGAWIEHELHWERDAPRTGQSRGSFRALVDQYVDHLGFVFWIRV